MTKYGYILVRQYFDGSVIVKIWKYWWHGEYYYLRTIHPY